MEISVFLAFIAGVLSFFSPCILPLIPGYLSFVTGLSVEEIHSVEVRGGGRTNKVSSVVLPIVLFILGFSAIFILLGISSSVVGGFLSANKRLLKIVGGVIIIIFGLYISGIMKIRFLDFERRLHFSKYPSLPLRSLGAFLVGMVFALGWTPCIGPVLASILTYTASEGKVAKGVVLLTFYSLGLGLPFFICGVATASMLGLFRRIKKYYRVVSIVTGLLLIVIGGLMIYGYL